jgi:hypothetical protein
MLVVGTQKSRILLPAPGATGERTLVVRIQDFSYDGLAVSLRRSLMPRPVIAGFLAMALAFAGLPLLSIAFLSGGAPAADRPLTTFRTLESPGDQGIASAESAAFKVDKPGGCGSEASPEPNT